MKKYVYGIDIGGTSVKMGLFSIEGTLLKKWEIKSDTSDQGQNVIRDIYNSILHTTPNLDEVLGYGFGVPGPVINNNVSVVVNLGWKNVNLKEILQDKLQNTNIHVANDANVAALGEAAYGAGKGKQQVGMLTLGTGVGGGIVVDGKLVEGFHGAAGEIGHLFVDEKYSLQCNCGNKGCLETVASATGIKNVYYKLKEEYKGDSVLFDLEHPSAKSIFDAAKQNDEFAILVAEESSRFIGYACSVMSVMTNPEVIVIGGGVSRAGEYLLDKIRKHFDSYAFSAIKGTKIVEATLGNDAGIYGAARMVING